MRTKVKRRGRRLSPALSVRTYEGADGEPRFFCCGGRVSEGHHRWCRRRDEDQPKTMTSS